MERISPFRVDIFLGESENNFDRVVFLESVSISLKQYICAMSWENVYLGHMQNAKIQNNQ